MKTNFQDKLVVCFDLHDTLLNSFPAWLIAFEQITGKDTDLCSKIKSEFIAGGWKREICKKYGYDYNDVKNIYLDNVTAIQGVKEFYDYVKNYYKVFVITNATMPRAKEDIEILGIDFDKVYTRDNGIKPDKDYILDIMSQNNFDYMVMVGNEKERDIFDLNCTRTIIVTPTSTFDELKTEFDSIIQYFLSVDNKQKQS